MEGGRGDGGRGSRRRLSAGPATGDTEVPNCWHELLRAVRSEPGRGRIVVAGRNDSGKTTLSRFLARALADRGTVARIDCDPGQGTIGPPGTLGLVLEDVSTAADDPARTLRFVGSNSPSRHFLQMLTGIRRLADRAGERGSRFMVLDSSGYMDTAAGREYHQQAVDVVDPDHLILLGGASAIPALARPFRRRRRTSLHEVAIVDAVEPRSREERRAYRRRSLRRYFAGARRQSLRLDVIGYHGHVPDLNDPAAIRHRLVGVLDRNGFLLSMGTVRGIREGRELVVRAPAFQDDAVGSLQFGSLEVDLRGRASDPP